MGHQRCTTKKGIDAEVPRHRTDDDSDDDRVNSLSVTQEHMANHNDGGSD
jgi:hypothetical protein